MCPLTYQLGWFVLSPVDDSLKGLPYDVKELDVLLESFDNDVVHLGLQLQQFLDHDLVPLGGAHYGCP